MSSPRVSVLTTTYNGERFLGEAIESILQQSYTDLELIVVDDGSTDSSASIIRSFSVADERVRGIFLDRNLGIPKAANCGLRAARGEYVARMDSDDLCHRDRLRTQISYLDKHQRVHIVGCDYRAINEEGSFCSAEYALSVMKPIPISFGSHRVTENIFCCRYPVLHATIVCRRSTLLSVGGYREFLPMSEDDDLYCRVAALHGGVLNNLSKKLYYYRYYKSSTTQRFSHAFRMLIIHVIALSLEFRRRGFWDPLEAFPSLCRQSLRFRGISSLLFLQDCLVFSPLFSRARLHYFLRIVVILRRFGLKEFHHISLWTNLGLPLNKQVCFYISFCVECFRARKFRMGFLYLRHVLSLPYRVLFIEAFKILGDYSDIYLRSFRHLIFTDRWCYGLKYLFFAFFCNPLHTTKFLVNRFFIHFCRVLFLIFRKLAG